MKFWLCVLALFHGAASAAPDRAADLAQYDHTRWTMNEGAPESISAIAQTTDGYLWLGTDTGLVRFDGVRFERVDVAAPSTAAPSAIDCLYAPAGGGLWIGYRHNGLGFLKDGQVKQYLEAEGLPFGKVTSILEDLNGVMWVVGDHGLARLEGNRWRRIGAEWDYPREGATDALVAVDGTLWVATQSELMFLPQGARKFQRSGIRAAVTDLIQTAGGKLWFAQSQGPVRALRLKPAPQVEQELPIVAERMLFDPDGSLWLATTEEGLRRVPDLQPVAADNVQRSTETFRQQDGLSADSLRSMLRDREGVIWVGTTAGLDRFRLNVLAPAAFPAQSQGLALAAGEAGTVWAGSLNRPLMRLADGKLTYVDAVKPPVTAMYRDAGGVLWLGGVGRLWRVSGEEIRSIALPASVAETSRVQAITQDHAAALWVAVGDSADVLKYSQGSWTRMQPPALPVEARASSALTDRAGAVWLGYDANRVVRIAAGKAETFSGEAGLAVGNVLALHQGAKYHWIGGVRGLALFDGERFRRLGAADDALNGVSGIHESAGGDLWMTVQRGIAHISAQEIERALAHPDHRLRYRLFDARDGLPGTPNQLRALPALVAGSDGRLWFSTNHGVVSLDPKRIGINTLPPPLVIESIVADGKRYAVTDTLQLPVGTANIQIDYTALSMSLPQRVFFRYRLEGVDAGWQDVGLRRQAFYTKLDPGTYRFQVIASNNDGFWNAQGAVLNLVIPATFVQTRWFIVLCVAVMAGALWALHLLRMRQLSVRLEGRLLERERIAYELHDTLLEAFHGLVLRLRSMAGRVCRDEPARQEMQQALDSAEAVLVEDRERASYLRTHDS